MSHPLEYENRRAPSLETADTDVIKAKLTKKPQKPLQDKTQAQNITTGTLSKKLQIKNKAVKIPKSFQKSPLRISSLKYPSPKRLTPNAARTLRNRATDQGEKENVNPTTPSKTMRAKKSLAEKDMCEAYCNEVIRNISAEMSQINSIFEALKDDPSLKTYQKRLENIVNDIEAKLKLYVEEQSNLRDGKEDTKEMDQESVKLQELQEKLAQLQNKYVPKSDFIQVQRDLELSEEILEEHKLLLEAAVSLDSSQNQRKQLDDQNTTISKLQEQLLLSSSFESKYLESQNEVQQLRAAVTDLLSENEQLYNQQQK